MLEDALRAEIAQRQPAMIALRRDLHRHPELSFEEKRTSSIITERLQGLELDEVRTNVGGYGVVGTLKGGKPGKTVMIRADMDALPIKEQNEVEYRSENPAAMHACGHDGHVTIGLTVAEVLAAYRDEIAGTIRFAFQPAEERGGGAIPMIRDGALQNPEVDSIIGLHLWNNIEVGQLGLTNGPIFASADSFELTIRGKGGHGAMPHQTVDALVIAAQIVIALQTLVSREMTPLEPSVVTVGSFHSGSAFNVINEEAQVSGTFRAVTPEARAYLTRRIKELAEGVATAMRAAVDISYKIGVPAVINDPKIAAYIKTAGTTVLGADNVRIVEPVTIADDMSQFLLVKPGCYFLMGSGNAQRGFDAPHHHPRFDFDEACLAPAVEILGRAALGLAQS